MGTITRAVKSKAAQLALAGVLGAGAGFGGGELVEGETIDCAGGDLACTYLAAGIIEATRVGCADLACQALRRYQLGLVIEDLAEDVEAGEVFAIRDVSQYVADRVTLDDPAKQEFVTGVLDAVNSRLTTGYSEARFQPDETISGERLVVMLRAAAL